MDKTNLCIQFAQRLRDAMLASGHQSHRSTSGVSIHKLSEITGYSVQICRKYLRGEALPEPTKLVEIAQKLQVSPGWLLFGETQNLLQPGEQTIVIRKNLLNHLLTQAAHLYNNQQMQNNFPDFLMDLINDISQINASEEQSKKIIDLAMTSIKHFVE